MFDRASDLWRKLAHRPAPIQPAASAVEDDRRVWVRRHVSMETQVTPTSDAGGPSLSAHILNVSSGGIQLLVRWAFGPGDLLTVELPTHPGEPPVTVLACVAHSRPEGEMEWVVGCRFSAELGDADLAALGATRSKASSDNRNWSRLSLSCESRLPVRGGRRGHAARGDRVEHFPRRRRSVRRSGHPGGCPARAELSPPAAARS